MSNRLSLLKTDSTSNEFSDNPGISIQLSSRDRGLIAGSRCGVHRRAVLEDEEVGGRDALLRVHPDLADLLSCRYVVAGSHRNTIVASINIDVASGKYEHDVSVASVRPRRRDRPRGHRFH